MKGLEETLLITQIHEGTLDEINLRYGKELAGLNLRVMVDETPAQQTEIDKPFYETATPEQWIEALHSWAASHKSSTPPLSDDAIDRESIYDLNLQ